ncbi:MAG: hypothetical protein RI958_68 [Actinomycetota bacterium]
MTTGARPAGARPFAARLLRLALVGSCIVGTTAGVAAVDPVDAAAAGDELVVVAQQFNVAADGTFDISVQVPAELIGTLDDPDTDIIVTSYRSLTDRAAFLAVRDGTFPRTEDTFDVDPTQSPTEPLVSPAPPVFTLTSDDTFTLRIPTETEDRTSAALQLSQAGVHPVVVELRVERRRYEATTFVNRLPVTAEPRNELAIGLVLGQTSMPGVDLDGQPLPTSAESDDLARLTAALEAIDGTGDDAAGDDAAGENRRPVPRAVSIEPSSLRSLESADPALTARLTPLLAESDLVAGPRLPLDPTVIAATVPTARFDPVGLYTRWLREGEDLLDSLLPVTAIDRSIHLADAPLSAGAAVMLRNLGTRLVVLPFEQFAGIEGSTGLFTDTTQLVSVDLGDGSSIPAAVLDPYLADRLEADGDRTFGAAIDIVADLVVMADSIDGSGRLVERHGTILATSDLGVPDPALLGHLVPLLRSTPGLQMVDPADIATRVDVWLIDGRPVTIVPPAQGTVDLAARGALVADLTDDVAMYGSMFSPTDPAVVRWSSTVDAIPSTAVTDDQAAQMASGLDAEFAQLRTGLEVEASSFTLTGRTSTIRFGVRNLSDRAVTVRVQVNSSKIRFPQGDQEITIEAQSVTDVVADAVALSNGTSSVFIRVYPPAGRPDEGLVPEVVLTARVTSFAGVAQLVTVAAVLLIIAWWARHWQRSRRTKQAAHHVGHHPATATLRHDGGAASTELSPDAAASTLPPS